MGGERTLAGKSSRSICEGDDEKDLAGGGEGAPAGIDLVTCTKAGGEQQEEMMLAEQAAEQVVEPAVEHAIFVESNPSLPRVASVATGTASTPAE